MNQSRILPVIINQAHFQACKFAPLLGQGFLVSNKYKSRQRLQASERLLIDPSVHLGDLTDPEDVEELVLAGFVPEEPEDGSVRLQGSRLDYMGRVEVYHNHQWGSVCGFQWDRADAEVVCRQMGYDTGRVIAVTRPEFGPANDIPVYYNYVDCDGSEERLADCYAKKNFSRDGKFTNKILRFSKISENSEILRNRQFLKWGLF